MASLVCALVAVLIMSKRTLAAPSYSCSSFSVEVPIVNASQLIPPFPIPFPDDGYAVTAFANSATNRNLPSASPKLQNFTGSFNISVEYCTPYNKGPKAQTVQFLTHGIGFDKSYWDFRLPSAPKDTQYSYITKALAAGYSTFAWDRLGCGLSSVPDPYLEVQAPIELAVMAKLTSMLRDGSLRAHGVPCPKKVLHVGHSLGSEFSNALAALPQGNELSDGVVLTSFSDTFKYVGYSVASFGLHIAKTNQPARFGNRSTGYLTWGDKVNNQYSFLAYPYFDPAVLEYSESTKWPATVGEFLTQPFLNFNATNFKGPVLFLAAERDLIFCQGDCNGLFGPGSPALEAFHGKKDVEVYIQPNVGHGINLHHNATGAYDVVQNWAARHGF